MTRPISCEVVRENHTMKIALDRARLDASGGRKLTRHWPASKGLAPLIGAYPRSLARLSGEELARHGALLSAQLHALVGAAISAGFLDTAHFTRCFRAAFSLTPSEYQHGR